MLIFIEGMDSATNLIYWKPKQKLCQHNKLVYSFHFFESTSFEFDSYDDFKQKMDKKYGRFLTPGKETTTPLWLGEFGESSQSQWWNYTIQYLQETDISWAYWAYTGYKHEPKGADNDETFGIVDMSFKNVRDEWRLKDLQSIIPLKPSNDLMFL